MDRERRPDAGVDEPAVEAGSSTGSPTSAEAAEVADELSLAREQAQTYLEHLQRLQAEFDNYRKRVLREQTSAVELASEPVMRLLLDVLDEFELALMHASEKPDYDRFLHGVELVFANLADALRAEGLETIEAQGKPFDPELHEALMHADGDGDGDLVVDDVFRQGYTLKGRVIRPAGVRVARK